MADCKKCKNSLNKPYYIVIKTIANEKDLFCVSCWGKEEKVHRNYIYDFVYKVGRDGKQKELEWDEEHKQWQTKDGEADEDFKAEGENKKGFNWKSPWVIGGIILVVVLIVGLIIYFTTRKENE